MNSKIVTKIFFIIVFIFQSQVYSQDLFVGPDTYIYASNQYIYVENSVELNTTSSNLYLRNGAQLLQGTTGTGANKGLGNLSVFQEGTVNNFQYNYWCSPVGNVDLPISGNTPFGITQLGVPITETATTPARILGAKVYDGTASPFAIAPYWIYTLIGSNSYSAWNQIGSNTTINPGEGFTMKGTKGTDATIIDGIKNNPGSKQRYDFRGKPNDGTISISVSAGQLTLTGNPYPSAIDLQAFLLGEKNCTGIAYFWEQDKTVNSHYTVDYKGGYGTYSPSVDGLGDGIYVPATFYSYDESGNQTPNMGSTGNIYERKYAPIGQGFLISGKINGTVLMQNKYRIFKQEGKSNNSEFQRIKGKTKKDTTTVDVTPQIRFNTLIDNGPVSQMVVTFNSSATDDVDHAQDAISQNDGPSNNYFVINNNEYVIDAIPFDIDKKIPIGFRNIAQANYKITVNEMLNIPEVTNVYLHDKTTDLYYDIKNSFYELTLTKGTYNGRYEITFKNKEALGIDESITKNFLIHQDNTNKKLIINNPLQLELTNYSLYDVVGKLIFTSNKLGTKPYYEFSTAGLTDGVYIVKLSTNSPVEKGIKIIVKN